MWLCLIIHAAINQDFYFWRFLELPYDSVVFLSIMTSTSQELYQRANIAFLHLSLSRTIIIFANIIDICHPSQHFQMHFEKNYLAWIISTMAIFIITCFCDLTMFVASR